MINESEASTVRSSDLPHATWHTSSRSNDGGNGNCVEVAGMPDWVAMRDSKDPAGPMLAVTRAEWRGFLHGIRAGEFD
ncbi:MAG: DUF397 domain-containing protein [Pseudonocardiaceae bacterium]